jgi:hypothetical protein
MSETDIQHRATALLHLASTLRHYESVLCQSSGEHFNLFNILGIGHYEVRTHSPILAALLNPRGSHGQGAVFLKKFLERLERLAIPPFDAESARVRTEVSAGDLGRIDIVLTDADNHAIFIENKIYASLQENQLARYHEHNPNATLLFLTLNGDDPSDWKTNAAYEKQDFKDVFRAIAYSDDIVGWLDACRKESATAHGVREVITQYINLVKHLTHQSTSTRMNQEIIKFITKDDTGATYLAYASLRNAEGDIRKAIIDKVNVQMDALGKNLGMETVERFLGDGQKPENYFYTTPTMRSMNLKFGIRCSPGYIDFNYGFAYLDGKAKELPNSPVIASFRAIFLLDRTQLNGFWHVYEYCAQPFRNWEDKIRAEIIENNGLPAISDLVSKLNRVACEAAQTLSK